MLNGILHGSRTRPAAKVLRGSRPRGPLLLLLALLLPLAACAPGAFGGANPDDPAVAQLQRAAEVIYHRMELGRLELGAYTTTPLVDAAIPEGATLTLVDYDAENGSTYTLLLTSSRFTEGAWRITPRGVSRVAAP